MYSVPFLDIIEEFGLDEIFRPSNIEEIFISSTDINRPGLQLANYFEYFDVDRIQVIGKVETSYLETMSKEDRTKILDNYFELEFPALVITRGLEPFSEIVESAKKHNKPLYRTNDVTSTFLSEIIKYLNLQLAPRITKHGVFVEVYGEGVLILGESGVGKSETALELVKRGHRLVADDVVEIRKVSELTLLGRAPDIVRHFLEIRGIGILDVKNLFGMGAVKVTESISLVISLEVWNNEKNYERLGLVEEFIEILGIKIPVLTMPIRPGRNLAIIVEVAAMNHRQKKMGYNAAKVLNERLLNEINSGDI